MAAGIRVERDSQVTIITMDRPDVRNALDSTAADALRDACLAFDADDTAHVAILTGAGGHFCAGADLKALANGDRRPVTDAGPGPMGPTRLQLGKPVLAAIEGYTVAGGLELALWCDLRVAADDAVLGVFCRRVGVPLVDLGTVRLPRLVGHGRAMDMILTGRGVAADEALSIGLVNRVAPHGNALDTALELAHGLAALPQTCMRSDRLSALEQWGHTEVEATVMEARRGRDVIASGEPLAGATRFRGGAGRGGTAL